MSGEPALQAAETVRSVAAFFLVPDAALADPRCDRPGDRRRNRGGPAVEMGLAIEVGGAQFQARDVTEPENRAVGIRTDDDAGEIGRAHV